MGRARIATVIGSLVVATAGIADDRWHPTPSELVGCLPRESLGPVEPGSAVQQEAEHFWTCLLRRYQTLDRYADEVEIEETVRLGDAERTYRSRMHCSFDRDQLRIVTPASQALGPLRLPCPAQAFDLQRKLWTAPHMALRFAEDPLAMLRHGVCGPFLATELEPVREGDDTRLRLRLEATNAVFQLFIDPASMLIVRLEGRHPIADHGVMHIRHTIRPTTAEESPAIAASVSVIDEQADAPLRDHPRPERRRVAPEPDAPKQDATSTAPDPNVNGGCAPEHDGVPDRPAAVRYLRIGQPD